MRRFTRLLEDGDDAKRELDAIIDAAGAVVNLRTAISRYRKPRNRFRFFRYSCIALPCIIPCVCVAYADPGTVKPGSRPSGAPTVPPAVSRAAVCPWQSSLQACAQRLPPPSPVHRMSSLWHVRPMLGPELEILPTR